MEYFKEHKNKLICTLCSHYCSLKKEQVGICGINKNTGKKIQCLVYGYIGNAQEHKHTFCTSCNKILIQRQGFLTLKNEVTKDGCICGEKLEGVFL